MLDAAVRSLPREGQLLVETAYVALGTFFMLSGFLLAHGYGATQWNRSSLLGFGIARFARVYPVYFLSLLVIAPMAWRYPEGERAGVAAAYAFILQGWTVMPVKWNAPAWSLSCEIFFYLCFPLAVVFLRGSSRYRLPMMAALAFLLPWAVRAAGMPEAWKPPRYLGDFLLGLVLARVYDWMVRGGRLVGRGDRLYLPAAALGLGAILAMTAIGSWVAADTILRLANAGIVLGLALGGGLAVRALSTPAALLAGKATYAMYILHIPALWWYRRWLLDAWVPAAPLVYIAGVVLVSAAVFRFYEEPVNHWIRGAFRARAGTRRRAVPAVPDARRRTCPESPAREAHPPLPLDLGERRA